MNYIEELEKIDKLLANKHYQTIIRNIGWLFEMAFKDLYKQQIDFFERNKSNPILSKEYNKLLKTKQKYLPDFDVDRTSFAQISYFFYKTNFNQLIELRINTPLTFTQRLPWREIRELRNILVHTDNRKITRKETLKFIDYLQTYLKETKLTESSIPVSELTCYSCQKPIYREWKYCPNCGANLSLRCKKCGTKLQPHWAVCPKCSTPREGVKVENPKKIYGYYCQAVWSDGYLNREENVFLRKKQKELGLEPEEARKIELKFAPNNAIRFRDMVESCLTDDKIDSKERVHLRKKADELSLDHKLANIIYLSCMNEWRGIPLFDEEIHQLS